MTIRQVHTKKELATKLGLSISSLYYKSKKLVKDYELKIKIEEVLDEHPSYGYRRVATHLKINKKRIQRVMRLFNLKAYRRRGRKWRKIKTETLPCPNLIKNIRPRHPNHIWAADFTHISWHGQSYYLATIIDIFTREIVGWALAKNHALPLILQAFFMAINKYGPPIIFHSDNGSEYISKRFVELSLSLKVAISRSQKGCPWENNYQESFYSQFKIDLSDPNRFKVLGEFVCAIHHQVWEYNHRRIHTALKMSPILFAERYREITQKLVQSHS